MHYRNGREAKNGDTIVALEGATITKVGVLQDATPGNDFCNGNITTKDGGVHMACLVDCLHVEDVAEILKEKGLDQRPSTTSTADHEQSSTASEEAKPEEGASSD